MEETNNQNQNNQNGAMHNDPVKDFTAGSGNNNTVMGVLSYLGPLVLIPYLTNKSDEFVKFHTKQGMVLFGIEIVVWLIGSMMYSMMMIGSLLNLATLVLTIIGIVNVVQGNKKELPVVGAWAENIKI